MSEMNMRRVWPRVPKTVVKWSQNVKTSGSGGFDSRNPVETVDLIGYVAKPKPRRYVANKKGQPVLNDKEVYFLGRPAIRMNDNIEADGINYFVSEVNYRLIGDFSHIGLQFLEEISSA